MGKLKARTEFLISKDRYFAKRLEMKLLVLIFIIGSCIAAPTTYKKEISENAPEIETAAFQERQENRHDNSNERNDQDHMEIAAFQERQTDDDDDHNDDDEDARNDDDEGDRNDEDEDDRNDEDEDDRNDLQCACCHPARCG